MSAISILRQSDFIGRLVLERKTAEEFGRIAELWLDPKTHQIIGLSCKAGLLGTQRHGFTWSQIESIGDDSIMVCALRGVDAEKPEGAIGFVAQDVWTDSGRQVGGLIDYRFHAETGDVMDYIFVFNGWRSIADSGYCIPPRAVVGMNPKRIIVIERATENPERFVGRLDQSIASLKDFLKTDLARTHQGMQTIATQLQGFTQKNTERLKGSLSNVTSQLQAAPDEAASDPFDADPFDAKSTAEQTTLQDQTIATSDVEAPIVDKLRAELIVDSEPIELDPIDSNPIDPNPIDPNPSDSELINPDPIDPNPIDPNPINPELIDPK
jgi:uncharacterized protein YrrD